TIQKENMHLWQSNLTETERLGIAKKVQEELSSNALTPQNRLRVALLALSAIPLKYDHLVAVLHNEIVKYPVRRSFRSPGAQQIWGVAFNPLNRFEVAIGDDNGAVTLWDSASNQVRDRKNAAAGELVNSVAFSADGTLLAAAYRVAGT